MLKKLLLVCLLSLMALPLFAQEDSTDSKPIDFLICTDGSGCKGTESTLTQEEATIILGTEAPDTDFDPYVVCYGNQCTWGPIDPSDADVLVGGDGEVDYELDFTEDEVNDADDETMDFTDEEGLVIDPDEMIFTEEEVREFEEKICAGQPCKRIPMRPEDLARLLEKSKRPAIQPFDGSWLVSILSGETNCPGGKVPLLSQTVEVTFSKPFVVQDVMDLSGAQSSTISYSNNPNSNTYIAGLDMGNGVSVQYAYRVLAPSYIVGNMYLSMPFANCSATAYYEFAHLSD